MNQGPHTRSILTVALVVRLFVLCIVARYPHDWLYGRGIELGILARSLATGHGLSSPFGGNTGPTALLAPGYPLFIAGCFRLFGSYTWPAALFVMLAQLAFSLLTVCLIVRVTFKLFGARAADFAGSFWAISLPLIWMPTIFWESCLSTLLLTGMIAIALRPVQPSGAWHGAYTALAGLVNPALLPALLATMAWIAWRRQGKTRRRYIAQALLVFCLLYSLWPLRNVRVLHALVVTRTTVGLELWMGNHPGSDGFLEETAFPIFNRKEFERYGALGEVAYMREKSSAAWTYISAHPMRFAELSAVRTARFWTGTGNRDGSILFAFHALLTSVLGLGGLWRLLSSHRTPVAILFSLPLLLFPLPYYITHAEFRYRLVIDPLLTILAAHCVEKT